MSDVAAPPRFEARAWDRVSLAFGILLCLNPLMAGWAAIRGLTGGQPFWGGFYILSVLCLALVGYGRLRCAHPTLVIDDAGVHRLSGQEWHARYDRIRSARLVGDVLAVDVENPPSHASWYRWLRSGLRPDDLVVPVNASDAAAALEALRRRGVTIEAG